MENLPISDVNRREIYRYLGYRAALPEPNICEMCEQAVGWFEQNCMFRAVWARVVLKNRTDYGCGVINSRSLERNLERCHEVFLFAGTIGLEADRKIKREEVNSETAGVITDAAASAAVEAGCNLLNARLGELSEKEGNFLRPRFSPGYGDFPIDYQKGLLALLSASKHIGITLTPSVLMLPTKSVSALIGISPTPAACKNGCLNCEKTDCPYRN